MKLLTIFPLAICLLAIWMGFPSVVGRDFQTGQQSPQKPGQCPISPCFCLPPRQPDQCQRDNDCEGRKKCCNYCFELRCLDPI